MSDEPSQKKQRVECKDAQENEEEATVCAICFESERTVLECHGCDRCKPGAWSICEICNDSLLSRTCPFCKGDYKALKLYQMPGTQVHAVMNPTLSPTEKMVLMIKIKALGDSLIPAGNTLLWSPLDLSEPEEEGRALFVLPKGFGQPSDGGSSVSASVAGADAGTGTGAGGTTTPAGAGDADGSASGGEENVALISVNMHYSELCGAAGALEFDFVNCTWSMLEGAVEGAVEGMEGEGEGEDKAASEERKERGKRAGSIEFQSTSVASAAVLRKAISTEGAVLLLPLAPTYWKEIEEDLNASVRVGGEQQ